MSNWKLVSTQFHVLNSFEGAFHNAPLRSTDLGCVTDQIHKSRAKILVWSHSHLLEIGVSVWVGVVDGEEIVHVGELGLVPNIGILWKLRIGQLIQQICKRLPDLPVKSVLPEYKRKYLSIRVI